MAGSESQDSNEELTSGGYLLFVPPTRLSGQPRIVAIDDVNNVILSVEYETAGLQNTTSWGDLALHSIESAAIMFPRASEETHQNARSVKVRGSLVSIEQRTSTGIFVAKRLGTVEVAEFPRVVINWDNLAAMKGPQIIEELRKGLLRYMFDNGMQASQEDWVFTTPASILNEMPRRWDQDASVLNEEMDRLFIGASRIEHDQKWRLHS